MTDSRQHAYRPCTRGLDGYTRWLAHCVCRLWQRHEERVRLVKSPRWPSISVSRANQH